MKCLARASRKKGAGEPVRSIDPPIIRGNRRVIPACARVPRPRDNCPGRLLRGGHAEPNEQARGILVTALIASDFSLENSQRWETFSRTPFACRPLAIPLTVTRWNMWNEAKRDRSFTIYGSPLAHDRTNAICVSRIGVTLLLDFFFFKQSAFSLHWSDASANGSVYKFWMRYCDNARSVRDRSEIVTNDSTSAMVVKYSFNKRMMEHRWNYEECKWEDVCLKKDAIFLLAFWIPFLCRALLVSLVIAAMTISIVSLFNGQIRSARERF